MKRLPSFRLGLWLRSLHSHPRTSRCLIFPRFPFCRGLHWLAIIAYWGCAGPSRPSHSPAQDISLLGHIHTCPPPPRKVSTVHMSVLTCGHLCIRTHLRTHILWATSSYPIHYTHFTHKPRFKFPTSRGRGLIPEVRMATRNNPRAHSSGFGSCEIDRNDTAKALSNLLRKTRKLLVAPEPSMPPKLQS